jgi:hypothetical protein
MRMHRLGNTKFDPHRQNLVPEGPGTKFTLALQRPGRPCTISPKKPGMDARGKALKDATYESAESVGS